MGLRRVFVFGSIALFGTIGAYGLYKKNSSVSVLKEQSVAPKIATTPASLVKEQPKVAKLPTVESKPIDVKDDFPEIDRTFELFTTGPLKLPIVETVTYSSHVPWLQGRLAWVADYASHYSTSRHFIARSLNGRPDYFSQKVQEGSRFNVFKPGKKIEFYLLVDLSKCKMAFYYLDLDTNERVLIKTYRVGLGKKDPSSASGSSTPLGRFVVGDKIAIYKPGVRGLHDNQEVEMISVYGTRWLPLGNGYGIQGAPWTFNPQSGQWQEDPSVIGSHSTDGGIRLAQEDLEELFAIVITRPTTVEIVQDFREAALPGIEVATPRKL